MKNKICVEHQIHFRQALKIGRNNLLQAKKLKAQLRSSKVGRSLLSCKGVNYFELLAQKTASQKLKDK